MNINISAMVLGVTSPPHPSHRIRHDRDCIINWLDTGFVMDGGDSRPEIAMI
jgi:hypothetical protein